MWFTRLLRLNLILTMKLSDNIYDNGRLSHAILLQIGNKPCTFREN
jgi:hypothetical protein